MNDAASDNRRWRIAEVSLAIAIAVFVVYCLTGFRFATLLTDPIRQTDFQMWYLLPPQIRASSYPSVVTGNWKIAFPYFPSAVAMMLPLSWMPRALAFALWMSLQCISLVIILWTSLCLAGVAGSRARMPIAAAAVFIVSSPLQWDLRSHNNNLIYLALVMLGLVSRRTWVGAALFAATANLKIYSGVLVAGFLWRREYRMAVSMAAAGLLIAVVLPILTFGYSHFVELIPVWFDQMLYTVSPAGQALAPLLLKHTATALFGAGSGTPAVTAVTISVQLLWIGLVVGYFVFAAKPRAPGSDSNIARLCDVIVLLLLPLPLSSWLVPYHALVMLPAFVLILARLIDRQQPQGVRAMAAIAVAGCVVMHLAVRAWELRAGVYLVDFVLVVLALGAIRLSLRRTAPEAISSPLASPGTAAPALPSIARDRP